MNSLELLNISFAYGNKVILNNISFCVHKGNNLTILGGTKTGKTSLAKLLHKELKYQGSYKINGVEIVDSNAYLVDRFMAIVNNEHKRISTKVVDVLFDALNGKEYSSDKEEKIVKEIIKYFSIDDLIDIRMDNLTYDNYFYIKIIAQLILKKDYLIIDDVLCHLKVWQIDAIYNYCKDNHLSIINLTTQIEETLKSAYLICLYDNKIAMEGLTLSCLKEEKLLKRIGFNLPFMIDLSIQLTYYGVLDKIYLNKEDMVAKIWN